MRQLDLGFRGARAMSLVEVLVGLLIGTLVVLAGVYGLKNAGRTHELEVMESRLQRLDKATIRQLKIDLDKAIQITGETTKKYPGGIMRWDPVGQRFADPRGAQEVNDGLVIIQEYYPEFYAPLLNIDQQQLTFNTKPFDEANFNIGRFLEASANQSYLFMVSNPKTINVFERFSNPTILPEDRTSFLIADPNIQGTVQDSGYLAEDFIGVASQIRVLSWVEYLINAFGNLERIERKNMPAEIGQSPRPGETPLSVTTIAKNVLQFRVDYEFTGHRPNVGNQQVLLPDGFLSHFQDPVYFCDKGYGGRGLPGECCGTDFCCDNNPNCVRPMDIGGMRFMITYQSEDNLPADSRVEERSGFSSLNGYLTYSTTSMITPAAYGGLNGSDEAGGEGVACLSNNPASRCQKDCYRTFDNPSRESPRWIGYGQYIGIENDFPGMTASNYCRCGGAQSNGADFIFPESNAGYNEVPPYKMNDPTTATRLEACVAHFGPCTWWAKKDPRAAFACVCVHDTDTFVPEDAEHYFYYNTAAFDALVEALRSDPQTANEFRCVHYNKCKEQAALFISPTIAESIDDRCECLTYDKLPNGNDDPNTQISEKDFTKLCSQAQCPNITIEGSAGPGGPPAYLAHDEAAGLIQGMSVNEAVYCSCGLTSNGLGRFADYRGNAAHPPDPNVPGHGSPTSGSRDSILVDTQRWTPGPVWENFTNQRCDNAQCLVTGRPSLGCCTSRSNTQLLNFLTSQELPHPFPDHLSYCFNSCGSNNNGAEVQATRYVVLNIDPNNPLPRYCGGDSSNYGGGIGSQ